MAHKKNRNSNREQNSSLVESQEYDDLDLQADEFVNKVCQRIREIRAKKGMSLIAVEEAGYPSWKHLQKIESSNKQPTLKTIYKIAKALGIPPAELFKGLK